MAKTWYVEHGGESFDRAISSRELKALAKSGEICPTTKVRTDGGRWVEAKRVVGLFEDATGSESDFDNDIADMLMDSGTGDFNNPESGVENVSLAKKSRTCPYCKEEINHAATKCRHCGEFLDVKSRQKRARSNQRVCPHCRELMQADAGTCPRCTKTSLTPEQQRLIDALIVVIGTISVIAYFYYSYFAN